MRDHGSVDGDQMSRQVCLTIDLAVVADLEETSRGLQIMSVHTNIDPFADPVSLPVAMLPPSAQRRILDQYQSDVLRDDLKDVSDDSLRPVKP